MTREQEAKKLTEKAKELNRSIGRSSLALGGVYKLVDEGKLFKEAGFDSFEEWLAEVGDLKRSQAYSLIGTYRELQETIPEEAIETMQLNNARDLVKVPAKKRTAALVRAASEMSNKNFREEVEKVQPGLALEERGYKGFQLDASQRLVVNQAINLARQKENLETDGAALELVCSQFLAAEGETPQYVAAKTVADTVESAIDTGDLAKPPEPTMWGVILTAVERMETVFGFKKRSMPRGPAKIAEGARVQ
jgi:hypothetical protein